MALGRRLDRARTEAARCMVPSRKWDGNSIARNTNDFNDLQWRARRDNAIVCFQRKRVCLLLVVAFQKPSVSFRPQTSRSSLDREASAIAGQQTAELSQSLSQHRQTDSICARRQSVRRPAQLWKTQPGGAGQVGASHAGPPSSRSKKGSVPEYAHNKCRSTASRSSTLWLQCRVGKPTVPMFWDAACAINLERSMQPRLRLAQVPSSQSH